MNYTIHYHDLPEEGEALIYENRDVEVHCFQLDHRVPCCGFKFVERFPKQKINKEKLEAANVPSLLWGKIQQGLDVELENGTLIKSGDFILEGPKPRSYAYCSDTKFTLEFADSIRGTDTIYVDSTFMNGEEQKAEERFHCTSAQAAQIAKSANVGRLLLGHFSSKYKDLNPLLQEAREVFPTSELALEGKTFSIELRGVVNQSH